MRVTVAIAVVASALSGMGELEHAELGDMRLGGYVVPWKVEGNEDVIDRLRKTPGATLVRGPLLLAKSVRVGDTAGQILDPRTVNGGGWSVRLKPVANPDVAGAWTATFTRGDESFRVGVCDFASAADSWYGYYADAFSVRF